MQPQNPYDFITNPTNPPKRSFINGGSMRDKIIIVSVGLLVIVLVGSLLSNLLAGSDGATDQIKRVVARQQEIVRIAEAGLETAQSPDTKAFAITTSLSVRSDQSEITALLTSNSVEMSPEELASAKNSDNDDTLESAQASSRYDEAFRAIMTSQIEDYLVRLRAAYEATSSQTAKDALEASYGSAEALLGQ